MSVILDKIHELHGGLSDRSLRVAEILQDWGMDEATRVCGLSVEAYRQGTINDQQLESVIGKEGLDLVANIKSLFDLEELTGEDQHRLTAPETLRRSLLMLSGDVRVLFIMLAHRQARLESFDSKKVTDENRHYAQETLEIYAPLADRLGMGQIKGELEDLSFPFAMPAEHKLVRSLTKQSEKELERTVAKLKRDIKDLLSEKNFTTHSIHGRKKHNYSIYKKLKKVDGDISQMHDLLALRIILDSEAECYRALGAIHERYKPLVSKIKDYIATPKPNGYQSLHTTVFGPRGDVLEIQIRTQQMHEEAELGLAAHFSYDQFKQSKDYLKGGVSKKDKALDWVSSLANIHEDIKSGEVDPASVKLDLFSDRIFVLTPKGDVFELPEGASALDFAFRIHSDVGLRTQMVKVNGQIAPLSHRLENRDMIEVVTRKEPLPTREWLKMVKTDKARGRLRQWFRELDRDQHVEVGKASVDALLEQTNLDELNEQAEKDLLDNFNSKKLEDIFAAVGDGLLSARKVANQLEPPLVYKKSAQAKKVGKVIIGGIDGLSYQLAKCCVPELGDKIVGFLGRGHIVSVHQRDCDRVSDDHTRLLKCSWE